jgi:hypothetical protein
MSDKQTKNNRPKLLQIILGTLIIVLVLWSINLFLTTDNISQLFKENIGVFGDKFGAVNALFSGLAFAGIIITIWLQREDLKETRKEMEEQRKVLTLERFEQTFFNLVNLHNNIVSSCAIKYPIKDKVEGQDVFGEIYNELKPKFGSALIGDWEEPYNQTFRKYHNILGHYFRNLYRIIKFVDEYNFGISDQNLEFKTKYSYIAIVRAQLSMSELCLIFYNGISENGTKFYPYVENYALIKNMDRSLIGPSHFVLYSCNAYQISKNKYEKEAKALTKDSFQ